MKTLPGLDDILAFLDERKKREGVSKMDGGDLIRGHARDFLASDPKQFLGDGRSKLPPIQVYLRRLYGRVFKECMKRLAR